MVTELPAKIGAYTIKTELHDTGRSRVIHAHEDSFDGDVVIKFLPADIFNDPDVHTTFEREIQIIALLEHPAIVPIYDVGSWEGQPYIVMRYMAGGTLAERLGSGPLSLAEVAYIIDRVASALDAAHEKGIVHRDLKPSNILFDAGGQAYLSDFSMTGQNHAQPTALMSLISGDPAYMSPEQIYGAADLTWQSDIYALGALLFTMLTGRAAVEASPAIQAAVQQVSAPLPDILEAYPDLPQGFQAILEKAMAKAPQERYEWAGYLAIDVAEVVADPCALPMFDGGAARAEQQAARARKQRQLIRWGLGLLGLFVFLGAATGILLRLAGSVRYKPTPLAMVYIPTLTATLTPTISPQPTQTATVKAASLPLISTSTPTHTPTPIPSPSATPKPSDTLLPSPTNTSGPTNTPLPPVLGGADRIAFLNENDIWIANLDGSGLTQLATDKNTKKDLQWLPDGSALTYWSASCYWKLTIGAAQAEEIGCFDDFEVSPDMSQVIVGDTVTLANKNKDWLNYLLPYSSLADLSYTTDIQRLRLDGGCLFAGGRQMHFSHDGQSMAGIFKAEQSGRQVDQIIVFSMGATCSSNIHWLDVFPGSRFTLSGYSGLDEDPTLDDFGWDGQTLFALNGKKRNDLGDLVIYNMNSARAEIKNPIDKKCCYQDIQFSPDGNYLLFVYKDINQETSDRKIYYIPYYLIESGASFEPVDLPFYFFRENTPNIDPALRPTQPSRP